MSSVQIELIMRPQRAEGFSLHPSGNRKRCGWLFIMQLDGGEAKRRHRKNVQLEEGEVGVAVVRLALALLHHIVLEGGRRLRIVAVEAVENLLHVLRPIGREVKGGAHGEC